MKNKMANKELNVLSNGNFKNTKELPMSEISSCMDVLAQLQQQCGKTDMNSLVSMYHDGITGQLLGFPKVNTFVHGMDCKADVPVYLEVKSISWRERRLGQMEAGFAHVGPEKAAAMQDEKVWLAVGVWFNINDLGFIIFGQNKDIGKRIERKCKTCKKGMQVTVKISLSTLIKEYGFQIISVSKSESEIKELLSTYNNNYDFSQMPITNISDFKLENQSEYNKRVFSEYRLENSEDKFENNCARWHINYRLE